MYVHKLHSLAGEMYFQPSKIAKMFRDHYEDLYNLDMTKPSDARHPRRFICKQLPLSDGRTTIRLGNPNHSH